MESFSSSFRKRITHIKTFGNSMIPLLTDGDIVYFKKTNFEQLAVNDIVCIRKKGKIITHRLIYKGRNYIYTKGDNNPFSDGKTNKKNIIGAVYKIKRGDLVIDVKEIYIIQTMLYFEELKKVRKAFVNNKISHIFLKGLPVHLKIEGKTPRRVYADCDILLENKFNLAVNILKNFGYQKVVENNGEGEKNPHVSELTFVKITKGAQVVLDIHFEPVFLLSHFENVETLYPKKLFTSFRRHLFSHKQEVVVSGEAFDILEKEELLLYLLLHIFNHNFQGTHRYDLVASLSKKELDYNRFIRVVYEYKLGNFIYPVLLLLKKYYGISVGKDILQKIVENEGKRMKIEKILSKINIFDDYHVRGDGSHFKLVFLLSPQPFHVRILTFFSKRVLHKVLNSVKLKMKYRLWLANRVLAGKASF